jgi:hypothetical protein
MSLQTLKTLNLDRILDNDEAVSLSAYARQLADEYEHLDQPVPEWLEKSTQVLREEIARRNHSADMARMKELERELEGYKTVGERKTEAQKRLFDLQKKLGMVPARARA